MMFPSSQLDGTTEKSLQIILIIEVIIINECHNSPGYVHPFHDTQNKNASARRCPSPHFLLNELVRGEEDAHARRDVRHPRYHSRE
jgi:hypothetical protein